MIMKNINARKRNSSGFTLIEVLMGILIFAVGMMALAKLQGNLARNSGDANARTVATNIAEEVIEEARVFGQIDSDGTNAAYNDIDDGFALSPIVRGNIEYTVVSDVTDYYISADGTLTTTAPADAYKSDFKQLDLTVTWNTGLEFDIDGTNTTSGRLGTGSIRITDVISSITSGAGGKAALGTEGDGSYAPPVDYHPGDNPDIISISLGASKFKESTTPLPDVTRTNELVETTFDVVTYSQDNSGATFLRREEFRAISCECTLRTSGDSEEGGLRPTIWDGFEYTEGEFVAKSYGESASNQQSQYCDICCRDHHDGGYGSEDDNNDPGRSRYNPFRYEDDYYDTYGDHKHYNPDSDGVMIIAESDGDTYVEACRMIRKDGFWRIAQNLRQEGLNSFPADYLDGPIEVGIYSKYVTEAVTAYELDTDPANGSQPTNPYEETPPDLMLPANMTPALVFPASTESIPTNFPTASGDVEQQLRARGIYIDYLSDALRERINCLDEPGATGEECEVPDVNSALEIIPFYDVQLTWLARWNEFPSNNPVDVTNQAIANDNSHDRGMASLEAGFGPTEINSAVHPGNLGLTGTDPIDPWYGDELEDYVLYALAVDFSTQPQMSGIIISGKIRSAVGGVRAADVEIEASGAACDRTNTGYECELESGAVNPVLTVSNYFKVDTILVACSDGLVVKGQEHISINGTANWTRFELPAVSASNVTIVIKENSCG
jgi:prepilin-type N-terminal cleavage/methylation domain-containing protein